MLNTLADDVRRQAGEGGERTAFIWEGRRTTFADFDRATSRVANALIAEGLGAEARFGFLCRNSDRVFELFYGAQKAGATLVGVNWRLSPDEAAYVLGNSGAKLLFTDGESLPLALAATRKAGGAAQIVLLDEPDGAEHLKKFGDWRDSHGDGDPARDHSDAVACQLYSSGTTGQPKGVLLTQGNFIEQRRSGRDTGLWMNSEAGPLRLVCLPTVHTAWHDDAHTL